MALNTPRLALIRAIFCAILCAVSCVIGSGSQEPLSETTNCMQLRPGQAALILNNSTGVPGHYRLSRLTDGNYEALLNLRFVAQTTTEPQAQETPLAPVTDEDLGRLAKHAQDCLTTLSPHLLGPGGEKLIIRIGADSPPPAVREIEVTRLNVRTHSALWKPEISCGEILHESLHLLGLVDEYQEPVLKTFDCRALGPVTSIMSRQDLALQAASETLELLKCSANPEPSCKVVERRPDLSWTIPPSELRAPPAHSHHLELLSESEPVQERKVAPARSTLIFPAEFRAITAPNCAQENSLYYSCAANAYRTSKEKGGEGCITPLPPECAQGHPDWLLN